MRSFLIIVPYMGECCQVAHTAQKTVRAKDKKEAEAKAKKLVETLRAECHDIGEYWILPIAKAPTSYYHYDAES